MSSLMMRRLEKVVLPTEVARTPASLSPLALATPAAQEPTLVVLATQELSKLTAGVASAMSTEVQC